MSSQNSPILDQEYQKQGGFSALAKTV